MLIDHPEITGLVYAQKSNARIYLEMIFMSASTATTMNIARRRRDEFDALSFLENVINPVTGGGGAMRTISIMSPITPARKELVH